MIIIFRIQIIIFIILIIISNLPGQSFFFAGSVDSAARVSKLKGCENRPRRPDLHTMRRSTGQALGAADFASRVCRPQARGAADPLALGLQPSAQVFPQGPRLGRPRTRCLNARASPASGGCNVGRGQVLVTCPIPKPGSPSARCSQPQGACLQTGAWGLQVGTSPFAHQTMQFTVKALTTYSTRTIVQNSAIYSESTHNAE